jgi:hypothetical protein
MLQPLRFYLFNILQVDSECRVSLRDRDSMNANYGEDKGISVRTSLMLFAAGWLLLALVAIPLPGPVF